MAILRDRNGNELGASEASDKIRNRLYNYTADFCLFLAQILTHGNLFVFDIQKPALANTQILLKQQNHSRKKRP